MRVSLKSKCKTFTLEKQLKDHDFDGLGERETFEVAYRFLVDKYKLTNRLKENAIIL